jgi:hypothetical protein
MKVNSLFSSLAGISTVAVLTIGLAAGVALVKQNQDIRNKAAELKEHKVAICHKTGSESNPWVQIEVSENAKEAHLANGDIEGNCPEKADAGGKKNDSSVSGGTGGVNLATNVTVNNQTVTASEVQVETKYVYVTTRFDFWVTFQGIKTKKPDKTVRVVFRRGDDELHVYNKVQVVSDTKGVYHGVITDVKPGTYEILIKGEGYLQEKYPDITLVRGRNNYNWSKDELLAGDFNSDNVLDSKDIAEMMSFYTQDLNPIADENKAFDVDMNGLLEPADLSVVLSNFSKLKIEGEN